jgi:hypothetical protein
MKILVTATDLATSLNATDTTYFHHPWGCQYLQLNYYLHSPAGDSNLACCLRWLCAFAVGFVVLCHQPWNNHYDSTVNYKADNRKIREILLCHRYQQWQTEYNVRSYHYRNFGYFSLYSIITFRNAQSLLKS